MCGIVGYTGHQKAVPILLEGLNKLEYRGYDSAGVVVCENGSLQVDKKKGRLAVLEKHLAATANGATVGIGHTRWATHGKPSDINAHPHTDCTGKIAVVHNGIIENYKELRERLQAEGHVMKSETDTEVLPHLIESYYQGDLLEAVRQAVRKVRGSYALVVMCQQEPGRLVAARQDSPLVVGLGEGENFVASDVPALLNHTRKVYYLDNGEVVDVNPSNVNVTDIKGAERKKEVHEITWEAEQAEKSGFEHFMLKEIFEQPKAIRDTLLGRIDGEDKKVTLDEISLNALDIKNLKKIVIVACGTAYHAGVVGKYFIEKITRIPVEVDIASEFRYREPILGKDMLAIVISQSGETADTLAALREAKQQGVHVIAVTNVVGSSVAREADDVMYTRAGPEIAVASTKAYVTQLIAMYLLGLYLAQEKGTLDKKAFVELLEGIEGLADKTAQVLESAGHVKEITQTLAKKEDVFFIGRGIDYTVALEGALKLKEISYIHAEAYAAGELKHGTLALVVKGVPVIALATQPLLGEKMLSNVREVKARNATVITVTTYSNKDMASESDQIIYVPDTHPLLAATLSVVPLQLIAYYAAVARGCDVDKPRNLAKSVTVE